MNLNKYVDQCRLVADVVVYSRTLVEISAGDPQLDRHVRRNFCMVMRMAPGTAHIYIYTVFGDHLYYSAC